ncbi:MAG: hypothetical protein QOH31_4275 [Verrucomicrobiota bacterium]
MGHSELVTTQGGRRFFRKTPRLFLLLECLGGSSVRLFARRKLVGTGFIMAFALCGCYCFRASD